MVTHNRRARLLQTLNALVRLPERWSIMVVDNGSTDDTAEMVGREFPGVLLIRSRRNIGAAARNIAVAYVHTPYVAFCSDDSMWLPGALQRAASILDENPAIGLVSGCLLEGESHRVFPTCAEMARSPLDRENLPGPQLLGFMADACIIRTRAFYDAGGFWPPLFTDGEEALLALDLANRGWRMVYMDDVHIWRLSARLRNPVRKRRRELRNAIWVAWMRLPWRQAWKETLMQLHTAAQYREFKAVLMLVLPGMARAIQQRHVITPRVAAMWGRLSMRKFAAAGSESPARNTRRSMV